ncbi:putative N-acetylmannosamine-6-phosphate 2-epimerase [Bacillus sp. J14TS2]|nr:N-acetylmannosamine-6-phosphate 2-epimerase [Bacillus sp. J14TS2]GIN71586.1 putative N-acetylmannosamine-6-phosphate 2-epimerase [Bacillus sp. J14TS2]
MSDTFFSNIKNELIVSCQALQGEPMFGSFIMGRMALAAKQGGAIAIRANGTEDIKEIKKMVDLPIIGLIKRNYPGSDVYITPTKLEIDELLNIGVDVVALDATGRKRPNGEKIEDLVEYLRSKDQLIMADISNLEEGIYAESLGVDCVSTTLFGYTSETAGIEGPNFELVKELSLTLKIPVIAEGRISSPEQAAHAMQIGAHSVVVGSAITRPQITTEQYVKKIKEYQNGN